MAGTAAAATPLPAPPGSPVEDEERVARFVQERFVDVFLGQSRRAQLGLLVAATLLAWVWFSRTEDLAALAWIAAVLVVTALRFRLTERFVRGGGDSATARIVLLLAINGVLMALPLAAFPRLLEVERAAVSIILVGAATASVATTSGYRQAFLAFASPMLIGLASAWALTSHAEGGVTAAGVIALMVLLYLLFLVGVGRQAQEVFAESSRFRYGEHERNRVLQLALEAADEASRAKTQFLAAASHDLRQPLHGMNVLVAALSLRQLDTRAREIVNLLDSVNQTLSRELDGLLDISKLDAGIVHPEFAVRRLDELLETHHSALKPVARERGIELRLGCVTPVCARTDAALLMRVLGNLSDNALKYTPRGGIVTMSLQVEGGDAVLAVADSGIGIAADQHEKVFREFYQVGDVGRDRAKGLGLGLSIVKRLCALLAVRLLLTSVPGEGTTVTLRLVALPPQEQPAAEPPVAAPARGLSVLVVDDEPLVRESMKLLLAELGLGVLIWRGPRWHPQARRALVTGDTAPDRMRDAQAAGVPLLHKPIALAELLLLLQRSGSASATGGDDEA